MFDIGWSELFVILVVTLVVVGPKDLPKVMRWAGYWTNRARMMAGQFQRVLDDMAREAELDKINKDLRESTRIDMPPSPAPSRPATAPEGTPETSAAVEAPVEPANAIAPPGLSEAEAEAAVVPAPSPVLAEVEAELARAEVAPQAEPLAEVGPDKPYRAPAP